MKTLLRRCAAEETSRWGCPRSRAKCTCGAISSMWGWLCLRIWKRPSCSSHLTGGGSRVLPAQTPCARPFQRTTTCSCGVFGLTRWLSRTKAENLKWKVDAEVPHQAIRLPFRPVIPKAIPIRKTLQTATSWQAEARKEDWTSSRITQCRCCLSQRARTRRRLWMCLWGRTTAVWLAARIACSTVGARTSRSSWESVAKCTKQRAQTPS